jgi:hypothetical protein
VISLPVLSLRAPRHISHTDVRRRMWFPLRPQTRNPWRARPTSESTPLSAAQTSARRLCKGRKTPAGLGRKTVARCLAIHRQTPRSKPRALSISPHSCARDASVFRAQNCSTRCTQFLILSDHDIFNWYPSRRKERATPFIVRAPDPACPGRMS